tara:strand:+ start:316 stop:2100 length:1785 start_codon:yes stop_codon:yes gene_type:complete
MSFSRFERILEKNDEYQTKLDEYDSDKYEKGSVRYGIHKSTTAATQVVGDDIKELWQQVPEEARDFTTEWGGKAIQGVSDLNTYIRERAPSKMGPLDPFIAAGMIVNQLTQGVSDLTGVARPIVDIAEIFVPYGAVFNKIKHIRTLNTSQNITKSISTLNKIDKGAEFAFKAQQLNRIGVSNFDEFQALEGLRQFVNPDSPTAQLLPKPVPIRELKTFTKSTGRAVGSKLLEQQQIAFKTAKQIKASRKDFTKTYNITTQGPLKHHHKFDQYLGARVANRTDSPKLFQLLEVEEGIELGDRAKNIIGLADQKTYLKRTSGMEDVAKQFGWDGIPISGTPERRLLDDLFKEAKKNERFPQPGDPQSWGLPRGEKIGTNKWKIGLDPSIPKQQQMAIIEQHYKNRFEFNKIDKSKIKYDRGGTIVSGDHIDLTHYTGIDSKDFTQRTELINLLESGEHLKLSTRQLKDKVTEVYKIQENIAVNVAIRRMNFIRDFIRNSGKVPPATKDLLLRDPYKLREWIVNNPGISGNIGWKLKKPGFKKLSQAPKSRHLAEWRDGESALQIVFGKGAAISRPPGWVPPATTADLNKLTKHYKK